MSPAQRTPPAEPQRKFWLLATVGSTVLGLAVAATVSGTSLAATPTVDTSRSPVGQLGTSRIVPGGLQVPLVADLKRPDVDAEHPLAGPGHGFEATYPVSQGTHKVCVTVTNIGFGSDNTLGCSTVTVGFRPRAGIYRAHAIKTGAWFRGWAVDPDTTAPINVNITVDNHLVKTVTANRNVPGHPGHGFSTFVPVTSGRHTICVIGVNVLDGTHNSPPACRTLSFAFPPIGDYTTLIRASDGSNDLLVRGYAFDPDTTGPITVAVTVDGAAAGTVIANHWRRDIGVLYPRFGHLHGFAMRAAKGPGEHTVCVVARNVGGGSNTNLGCKTVIAVHPVPPSAPRNVTATPGFGSALVRWNPPASDGGAPETDYVVTAHPGGKTVTVPGTIVQAHVNGLQSKTAYTFSVLALNVAGSSRPAVSARITTLAGPPPQRTPAPVSTSRYIRNVRGSSPTDLAKMRGEGFADAQANPSGHRYVILLDIGGQDQADGGVILSATTRFVSYRNIERDLRAYVTGYHRGQRATAPVTIALGTNNDLDVSTASGRTWASKIVRPLRRYASQFQAMRIAGSDDIEPGFRATYRQSQAWLGGYLSATRAPFVFNGSADGCSSTHANRSCNNGWRMTELYHLAAGAAPRRIVNLPQIYNDTMAGQWKYISLTGISHGRPRINFGGPLTEFTACRQAGSCGSLTGHSAWKVLWSNLQSNIKLKVSSLPYSTDLRIDR